MHIEHLAIWVRELEQMRTFYETYFDATANDRYVNPRKQFSSYFLTFPTGGSRLELMQLPALQDNPCRELDRCVGMSHVAFCVGSENAVDAMTERLRADGFTVVGEPRRTGDGYYESVVLDPEGNRLELTA